MCLSTKQDWVFAERRWILGISNYSTLLAWISCCLIIACWCRLASVLGHFIASYSSDASARSASLWNITTDVTFILEFDRKVNSWPFYQMQMGMWSWSTAMHPLRCTPTLEVWKGPLILKGLNLSSQKSACFHCFAHLCRALCLGPRTDADSYFILPEIQQSTRILPILNPPNCLRLNSIMHKDGVFFDLLQIKPRNTYRYSKDCYFSLAGRVQDTITRYLITGVVRHDLSPWMAHKWQIPSVQIKASALWKSVTCDFLLQPGDYTFLLMRW